MHVQNASFVSKGEAALGGCVVRCCVLLFAVFLYRGSSAIGNP